MTRRSAICAIFFAAVLLAPGCAGERLLQRDYEITGITVGVERARLAGMLRTFFVSRGLTLEREQVENGSRQLLFSRGSASLSIDIRPGPEVRLRYAEWIPASGTGKDFLGGIAAELSGELRSQLGEPAAVRFVSARP